MPDNYRTRQIVIISIIILFALILAYAFYRLLLSGGSGLVPNPSPQAPVGGSIGGKIPFAGETPILPEVTPLPSPTTGLEHKIEEQTLLALTDFSVVSATINKNEDKALAYKKDGGSVYAIDFAGNKDKTSNITIVGISEAL